VNLRLPQSLTNISVSFHPSHAMLGMPQLWPSIYAAIRRCKQASWAGETPRREWTFTLTPSVQDLKKYLGPVVGAIPIAVDIETPMEEHTKIELVGVSVTPGTAFSFPWTAEFIDAFGPYLEGPRPIIGHNLAFDHLGFLAYELSVKGPNIDTIQVQSLITPPFAEAKKRRWLALSTCVLRVLSETPYWKDFNDPRTEAFYKVAFPDVPHWLYPRLYNAMDVMFTLKLWLAQRELLDREGMLALFRDFVMPAAPVLVRMQDFGFRVHEPTRKEMRKIEQGIIEKLTTAMQKFATEFHTNRLRNMAGQIKTLDHAIISVKVVAGTCTQHPKYQGLTKPRSKTCTECPDIYNDTSVLRDEVANYRKVRTHIKGKLKTAGPVFKADNDWHWRALLFEPTAVAGLGLLPTEFTPKEIPVVSASVIEELQMRYPQVGVLRDRVDLQHSLHRLRGVLSIPVDSNGHAHVAFSMHRTENGRLSSGLDSDEEDKIRESPAGNLQNVEDYLRRMFIPDEGMVLCENDASQIELRVMAWKAPDIPLLIALRDGADIHAMNAETIFGCSQENSSKFLVPFMGRQVPARWACKRATHGWDYGLGDYKCGKMYQPFAGASKEAVVEYITTKWESTHGRDGLASTVLWRRINICAKTVDPESELLKAWGRLYQIANTVKAREWRLAYFGRWQGLAAYQRWTIAEVERERSLRNPLGRKLRFYGFKKNHTTGQWKLADREEALAFIPASTVADMAKWWLPRMENAALSHGGRLLTMTHDSFASQIPDDPMTIRSYYEETKKIMECEWPQLGKLEGFGIFSCPSDMVVGYNWGKFHEEENPKGLREYHV